ncbi:MULTISPECIES: LysR substrate-binding domain-containing protein [Rhizobium/Agrobacterium group]|uniref:HTH-type transcriptional regulator TtuA n=2 Tax=Rhizobium/Agrobacterium group TaxID=227290 RepID=A0A9X3KQK3_9HYPH|nr:MULTISPECIES: LysR substrate-binding domain-containing protein [Rhizobium/Agrobacterium group]MBO9126229.1 LysR family transcriptional regulator [Rhizobium sp. 16-488-2b]MBO9176813.1 LysR family transcriptional regulator [Rhizobium sp. 16-488-2a]MBO9197382.1 LysR family transcriptional regulator [Rhizobium sp. 16-449-1b]MCZ7466757.1 LysR substrate-binding domain-containing protein [Rhizobium rhizogenes]MCZ7939213.1 LysR substrate-binding domain-containing protein [Agrobacterium salinitolera
MHRLRSLVPSANYLFCFEAAARRRSFTAAAQELNVSQPAVSKTIRLLEEATGLKLFRREHTRLELTADGQRLYRETQDAFDRLHMVISSLQKKHSNDVVRVSFSAAFVQLWLLPRLKDFKAKHPDVPLRIEESSRDDQDLVEEDIDVSARLGDGKWPGLQSWHFFNEEILPVCSPDYLRDFGPIVEPADLLKHTLLNFEERHRTRLAWREWLECHSVSVARLRQDFVFTDALGSIEAAVRGQGIALGWKHLVQEHLEAGRLVAPLKEIYQSGQSVHLIMSAQRLPKSGAALFRDWLIHQI